MGYVIAGILLLLIVAAGVTFMVLSATRRQRDAAASDSDLGRGTPGTEAAIVAPDDRTPVGDTDQVSGEQRTEGTPPDARGHAEDGRRVVPESERLADRER
jgi:hypothetical protein